MRCTARSTSCSFYCVGTTTGGIRQTMHRICAAFVPQPSAVGSNAVGPRTRLIARGCADYPPSRQTNLRAQIITTHQAAGMGPTHPVRNNSSKTCRNDIDAAEMSLLAPLLRLFRQNCGAEIDMSATSTSSRHRFNMFSTNHFSLGYAGRTEPSPCLDHRESRQQGACGVDSLQGDSNQSTSTSIRMARHGDVTFVQTALKTTYEQKQSWRVRINSDEDDKCGLSFITLCQNRSLNTLNAGYRIHCLRGPMLTQSNRREKKKEIMP